MKKEYLKPEVDLIDFTINESLLALEADNDLSGELGTGGEFDF